MVNLRLISLVLISAFIFTNLIPALQVSAQEPMAFGEMNAAGDVKILSSTGQWVDMKGVYPLLKETKVRIADGTVSITTKRGSKIDLLQGTEAAITVANSTYMVDILNCTGNLSFNMTPSEMLTVITPETPSVIVQKAEVPSPSNIRGTILNKVNGTEIKSILGKVKVTFNSVQEKVLNSGEIFFVSGECTTAIAALSSPAGVKTIQIIPAGIFVTGGTIAAFDVFRQDKVASPSVPR